MPSRKHKVTALFCAVLIAGQAAFPLTAEAAIAESLNSVFNSMSNVTKPGFYEGIRRGTITGGEVQIRNKIVNTNIISYTPPHLSAGCGGIDFYAGAFSFINKEQFIAVLRAIPSNALGYAFKLAIDSISAEIGKVITEMIQKALDVINRLGNSCDAAMLLVDTVKDSTYFKNLQANISSAFGLSDDLNEAKQPTTNTGKQTKNNEVMKKYYGNMVYRALKNQNAESWLLNLTSDSTKNIYEEIMSLVGTVVVKLDDKEDSDGQTKVITTTYGRKLHLEDLLKDTSNATMWKCSNSSSDDSDHCTKLETVTKSLTATSISNQIISVLCGDSYLTSGKVGGLIAKFYANSTAATAQEQALITAFDTLGVEIRNMATYSPKLAATFVVNRVDMLVIGYLSSIVYKYIGVIEDAIAQQKEGSQGLEEARKMVQQAKIAVFNETMELYKKYGTPESATHYINELKKIIPAEADNQD